MTANDTNRKTETLGRRLASRRVLLGLSQEDVARRVGFAQSYLSQMENDKALSPPLSTVAKLAELYGVSIDYLAHGRTEAA